MARGAKEKRASRIARGERNEYTDSHRPGRRGFWAVANPRRGRRRAVRMTTHPPPPRSGGTSGLSSRGRRPSDIGSVFDRTRDRGVAAHGRPAAATNASASSRRRGRIRTSADLASFTWPLSAHAAAEASCVAGFVLVSAGRVTSRFASSAGFCRRTLDDQQKCALFARLARQVTWARSPPLLPDRKTRRARDRCEVAGGG